MNSRIIKLALIVAAVLTLLAGGASLAREFKYGLSGQGDSGQQVSPAQVAPGR